MQNPPLRALIPTAGFGTRLLPATRAVPKELLPVLDTPALQLTLDELTAQGVSQVVIVTQDGKEAVQQYLTQRPALVQHLQATRQTGLAQQMERLNEHFQFTFVRQAWPNGLGAAVLTARATLEHAPFFMLLADDLVLEVPGLLSRMRAVHQQYGCAVVALQTVSDAEVTQYGIAEVASHDDGALVSSLLEKPSPSQTPSREAVVGRYLLTPSLFPVLDNLGPGHAGELQLTDALHQLARVNQVRAVWIRGPRFDLGTPRGWLEAQIHCAAQRPELASVVQPLTPPTHSTGEDLPP